MFGRSDAPENIFQPKNLPAVRGYFDFVKSLSENGKKSLSHNASSEFPRRLPLFSWMFMYFPGHKGELGHFRT